MLEPLIRPWHRGNHAWQATADLPPAAARAVALSWARSGRRGLGPGAVLVLALALAVIPGCASQLPPPTGATAALAPPPVAAPAAAAKPRVGLEQLFATTGLWELEVAREAPLAVVTLDREGGIPAAWAIPLAGGAPRRMGPADGRTTWSVAAWPDGSRAIVRRDGDGDELSGLLVAHPDGRLEEIGAAGPHVEQFFGWRADGAAFFMATNEREATRFDLWEVATDDLGRRLLAELPSTLDLIAVAPSGRRALAADMLWTGDIDAWLLDLEQGTRRPLSPPEVEGVDVPVAFADGERTVLLRSSIGRDFQALVALDLASGERRTVYAPAWDLVDVEVAADGQTIAVTVNEDAWSRLVLLDAATFKPRPAPAGFPADADVAAMRFVDGGRALAVLASGPRRARDLWWLDVTSGGPARQLTDTAAGAFTPEQLASVEVVRFASFDGLSIPGVLYRPPGTPPAGGWPAVVWVHGGPGGQSTRSFSPLLQSIALEGFVVLGINHRGSDGYGRRFGELDDRRHGVDDVADCVAAIPALAELAGVDPERVAIAGASYGGYVTLAALAFRPQAFAAGVDLFGPANWLRTLGALRPERESARRALERELGDPADEAFFRAKSPLFHAGNIVRPLLVLQGANDRRVLAAESDEMVAAVRARGVPVEYLLFADEGHGFAKRDNRMRGYRAMLDFLTRHLARPGGPEP
jgi:dipeptidyl aminopeptidase/acylaminoacyl peptidase